MDVFSPSPSVLTAFLVVSVTLAVVPGPDMMFVIAHTLSGGVRAGRLAALGIATGSLIQGLLAIAGISAVVAASDDWLRVLTCAGAAYLIWVGVRIIRSPAAYDATSRPESGARPFGRGMVTNLLNIKVVLFYVTLLPLFVRSGAGPEWQQVLFFGVLFNALGTSILLCVAAGAERVSRRLRERPRIVARLPRLAGAVLIVLAVGVVWQEIA